MYREPTPPGLFLNSEMIKTRLTLQTVTFPHLKKKKHPTNPVSLVMTNSKPWQRSAGELSQGSVFLSQEFFFFPS